MIKLFRGLRRELMEHGKTARYFKYAIGEIILVVIGILVALAINNWNTERLNTNRNKLLLTKLLKELDLNIDRTNYLDSTFKISFVKRVSYNDSLLKILYRNAATDHLEYMVSAPIFFETNFNINTSVFEELKNTGSLYSIGSDSLPEKIQGYYQLCARESYYNEIYGDKVAKLELKCHEKWSDFKYLYQQNPQDALKNHPWISDPRSQPFIQLRQYIEEAFYHGKLVSDKLKGITAKSKQLKELIENEILSYE